MTPDERVATSNDLMRQIARQLPPGEGAMLLLFPFHRPSTVSYISNAQRQDMADAMRALLAKWESEGSIL